MIVSSGQWIFNGTTYNLSDKFINDDINLNDYTIRMIFNYSEWIYNTPKLLVMQTLYKIRCTAIFNHPSSLTISLYPILYLFQDKTLTIEEKKFLTELLNNKYKLLLLNIEHETGANHLTDNYISLCIMCIIYGDDDNFRSFLNYLIVNLNNSFHNGHFKEKKPSL